MGEVIQEYKTTDKVKEIEEQYGNVFVYLMRDKQDKESYKETSQFISELLNISEDKITLRNVKDFLIIMLDFYWYGVSDYLDDGEYEDEYEMFSDIYDLWKADMEYIEGDRFLHKDIKRYIETAFEFVLSI